MLLGERIGAEAWLLHQLRGQRQHLSQQWV